MSDNDSSKNNNIKKIAIVLFYIMFIYSGFNKIFNFSNKVSILNNKLHFFPKMVNNFGMVCVILLEIIGSFIIILYSITSLKIPILLVKITYILFLLFMIVVTAIYHPPISKNKIIPFLSNVTTFSGLLYMFNDKFILSE